MHIEHGTCDRIGNQLSSFEYSPRNAILLRQFKSVNRNLTSPRLLRAAICVDRPRFRICRATTGRTACEQVRIDNSSAHSVVQFANQPAYKAFSFARFEAESGFGIEDSLQAQWMHKVRFMILGQATIAALETPNASGCARARNRLNRKQEACPTAIFAKRTRASPPQVPRPIRTASESKRPE